MPGRKSDAATAAVDSSIPDNFVSSLGAGHPLDRATRNYFEPRFGVDFSHVRVFSGPRAGESASSINARAYTLGSTVVFGAGQYQPGTIQGKQLLAHELTHVVQQAHTGRALQRKTRSSPRFPSLEVAALRSQAALATGGARLLDSEISDARLVFGNSIDLSRVRIVYSPVISSPTTLGNTIRVPPAYTIPRRELIHELTHIWQFQTKGASYLSDSAFHQAVSFITRSNRSAAFFGPSGHFGIVPGKDFYDYNAEQQALIVEEYFADPGLRTHPGYQRLIDQVRRARPIAASLSTFEEMAAGLPPRGFEQLPLPGAIPGRDNTGVPQLELRF